MRRLILSEFVSIDGVVQDPGGTRQFADQMNAMRKHVVSTTLAEATWNNSAVIAGEVTRRVADLKAQAGGDILLVGSGGLARSLMHAGLIDEYRLMVFPVLLGDGARLFTSGGPYTVLRLHSTRAFASGATVLTYRPSDT